MAKIHSLEKAIPVLPCENLLTEQEKITFSKPTVINIIIQYLEEFHGQYFGTHNIEDVRKFGERKYKVSHNIGTYDRKWRELRSMYENPLDFQIEIIGKRFTYDPSYAIKRRENYFRVSKIEAEKNLFGEVING